MTTKPVAVASSIISCLLLALVAEALAGAFPSSAAHQKG
jgi:hypothetical protein